MIPYQHKVDIFSEIGRLIPEQHDLIVPDGVIRELQQLRNIGKGSDKIATRIAIELIEKKGVKIIESHGRVDEFILDFAVKNKSIVCTNDRELKRKLKEFNIQIICLRGRNRLEFS